MARSHGRVEAALKPLLFARKASAPELRAW